MINPFNDQSNIFINPYDNAIKKLQEQNLFKFEEIYKKRCDFLNKKNIKLKKYLEEATSSLNDREFGINYDSAVNNTSSSANLMMPGPPLPSWWGGKNRITWNFENMPDWYRKMFGNTNDFSPAPADRPKVGPNERGVDVEKAPRGPGSNFNHYPGAGQKSSGFYNGWYKPPKEFPVYSHQSSVHTIFNLDRSRYVTTLDGQDLPQGVFADTQPPYWLWTLGAPTPQYPQGVPYWLDMNGGAENMGVWQMASQGSPGYLNPWGIFLQNPN